MMLVLKIPFKFPLSRGFCDFKSLIPCQECMLYFFSGVNQGAYKSYFIYLAFFCLQYSGAMFYHTLMYFP